MRDMKQSILLFAVLVFLVGCGKKAEAAAPQAQPKAKEAKKAETATPKEAVSPWDTPTRFALFMAQKIENASARASALSAVATALAEAGEFKLVLQVAQEIDDARVF